MSFRKVRMAMVAAALFVSFAGCHDAPGSLGGVAGTWRATTYLAGPEGDPPQDILGLSVTWTIVMMDNGYAYSTMNATNPLTGVTTTNGAQQGGVHREGDRVVFHDFSGYRFLTERTWTVNTEGQLESLGQVVDGVKATIRFTRD
jgi:hypothetical protein